MDGTPIAIDVQNVSKRYGKKEPTLALKNISFQVGLGHICCVLGPNGSGKTTLLKILANLLLPTSGNIRIMGSDIHEDPILASEQIGWMPAEERSGFYGRLTGLENLEFFGTLQKTSPAEMKRHIGNLSVLLGIEQEIKKPIQKISGGERQKIGLARTLLHDPAVLILDEPFRHLDPHTIVRFRRLLDDHLARVKKKTIILSTHRLEEAQRIADSILVIHKGKLVRHFDRREFESTIGKTSIEDFYLNLIDHPVSK